MSNPGKRRGTSAETALVAYLRANGAPHAERRALTGNRDRGDIAGVIGVMMEVKDHRRDQLPQWVDQVEAQRLNDHAEIGVCWHKRRGTLDPGRWLVTMTGAQFIEVLRLTGHLPREESAP